MDPNTQDQAMSFQPVETQIFPAQVITPEQQFLLKQNLEKSKAKREDLQEEEIPKYYTYIFTRNYIIFSSMLIILAFVVFGIIIYLHLTGYVTPA